MKCRLFTNWCVRGEHSKNMMSKKLDRNLNLNLSIWARINKSYRLVRQFLVKTCKKCLESIAVSQKEWTRISSLNRSQISGAKKNHWKQNRWLWKDFLRILNLKMLTLIRVVVSKGLVRRKKRKAINRKTWEARIHPKNRYSSKVYSV